jgi:hypothetical protein
LSFFKLVYSLGPGFFSHATKSPGDIKKRVVQLAVICLPMNAVPAYF